MPTIDSFTHLVWANKMENVSLSSSSWRICDFCQDKEGLGPISKYGDFTPCFLDGVLLNATSLLMLAFGLKEIARLCRGPHPGIKFRRHWLLASRMTLVMFQIVLACIAIGKADSELEQQWASVSQRILGLASLCVALPLHWIEYHRSRVSNGVLLFFWLFEGLFTLSGQFISRFFFPMRNSCQYHMRGMC